LAFTLTEADQAAIEMAQLGLSLEDICAVLAASTVYGPEGNLEGANRPIVLDASEQGFSADAYKKFVVAYKNGADPNPRYWNRGRCRRTRQGGRFAAGRADDHYRYPQAARVQRRRDHWAHKGASAGPDPLLPPSIKLTIAGDRTQTIEASVYDVPVTLAITVCLVVLVIFNAERGQGLQHDQSIHQAALLRFRPIMMTSTGHC
jgi:multidrug efflux pump